MSIGVHIAHCCLDHGCKYGDPDCPVASGESDQMYPCESCKNDTFNYVKVTSKGFEGCINLFYRDTIIALVTDTQTAALIMDVVPERSSFVNIKPAKE